MSNFFTKIFKPSKKSMVINHDRDSFPLPSEEYEHQQRHGGGGHHGNEYVDQHPRLKSSLRRRGIPSHQAYEPEFLKEPSAAYHTSHHTTRLKGPRSLPPSKAYVDSPNPSPSSSTDNGYQLERSFHSEFIPSSHQQQQQHHHHPSASSSRRRSSSKKHRFIPDLFSRDENRQQSSSRYLKDESDSEAAQRLVEEDMYQAMRQIKKLRNLLSKSIAENREHQNENEKYKRELIQKEARIRNLESEIAILLAEKRSLEIENTSLKSCGYSSYGMQQQQHHHHHPRYYQPPQQQYPPYPTSFMNMTPPSNAHHRQQFNNTNTGSMMASGGGGPSNFRTQNNDSLLFGNTTVNDGGCGEQLAFLSHTTTASNAMLPGMRVPSVVDEQQDEIKNFRKFDETSPSRPPTNSDQSFQLSTGIGGSNSTGSSPPTNTTKTNDKTPTVSAKTASPPKAENSKMDKFNQIISQQLNALITPKSSKVKKSRSLSQMDEFGVLSVDL